MHWIVIVVILVVVLGVRVVMWRNGFGWFGRRRRR
jgi:hypothetical protein